MSWIKRHRVLLGVGSGLVGLYALIGFLLLPYIVKAHIIPAAAERLNHPIVVQEVGLNPFTLSIRINGLEVREQDQTPIFGFEELFVDLRATTLFLQAVAFDEIRLKMPFVAAKVNRAGQLNLLALIPPPREPSAETPPPTAPTQRMPVDIASLSIDQGILEYRDESKTKPVSIEIVPIHISLRNFSTVQGSENAYAFTAEIGKDELVAWEGNVSLDPIESDGKLSLAGVQVRTIFQAVQDQFSFDVRQGQLALSGAYHFDLLGETPVVMVKKGMLSLKDLVLGETDALDPVVTIPQLAVDDIAFDLVRQSVEIGHIRSADAVFDAWINPDGVLNYQQVFRAVPAGHANQSTSVPSRPVKKTAAKPWSLSIGEIALRNYHARFEDRSLARPCYVDVDAMNLSVKDVHVPFKDPIRVDLSMKLNRTGTLGLHGRLTVEPLMADVDFTLKEIGIRPFQPYLDRFLNVDVQDGAIDLTGGLQYAQEHAKGPMLKFQGNVAVNQLAVTDRPEFQDVVSWKSLAVNHITLQVDPTVVHIGEVVLQEPAARLIVLPDKQLNVSRLLVQTSQENKPVGHDKPRPKSTSKPVPSQVAISVVKLAKAAVTFSDLSIQPAVKTGITDLSGTIKGLSSKEIARADVALTGKVDGIGPVKISGKINPLTEDAFTDLNVRFDNIDLSPASPYAGKYAGYPISKGKLFLDLKYKIAKKELVGENKVLIDQLTFGDKTDSPDATSLPVPLAVALLKDRKGQIDIDPPVRGDLNDPDFKYGGVLLGALMNLMAKAATSPLSLLGGMVGNDEQELQFVEFAPGRADVEGAERKKIDTLKNVLTERPGLFLEISGTADPNRDRLALAQSKYVEELHLRNRQKYGQAADGAFSKDTEAKLTEEWYASEFDAKTDARAPELSLSDKRARLIEALSVDSQEIRKLAEARASRIRELLLEPGAIQEDRLILRDVRLTEEQGTGVKNPLALAGK